MAVISKRSFGTKIKPVLKKGIGFEVLKRSCINNCRKNGSLDV
jgi:hypothetical protein